MKLDTKSLVKGVKPHFTFSYAKGVFFNEDIYELSENEILTMCPDNVWKIFKVPKSNMIVLTFMDSIVPHDIIIENEIIKVRPYRQRPLQCFNCFGFAHVSDVCTRAKICQFCSQPEHGACTRPRVCANCRESHDSRNKSCNIFKKEQEALLLSAAEHISIGHAKKLLSQRSYSAAVQDFHPKPALSTTGLDRPQTVQSKTSRASSGGAPRASSGGDPGASSGGAPGASSGGAPRASSGGAPRAFSCGLSQCPLVGLLGPLLVGLPVSPLMGHHHHLWKHPRPLGFPRVPLTTQGFGLSLRAMIALWLSLGLRLTLIIFLCQDLYLTFRTFQTPMKILKL